jgi:hypothetical protein
MRTTRWAGYAPAGAFNLFTPFDAGIKLMRHPMVEEVMRQLGFNGGLGFPSGIIEAVCLVLYQMRRMAVLLTGLWAWGGLWLRDPLLRSLLPIRRMAA